MWLAPIVVKCLLLFFDSPKCLGCYSIIAHLFRLLTPKTIVIVCTLIVHAIGEKRLSLRNRDRWEDNTICRS